ncbi:MAG: hypothetical protein H6833_11565 [Planctomycetes bacterium]|nr:hypothetical protein [Planctomycetota bacterium]
MSWRIRLPSIAILLVLMLWTDAIEPEPPAPAPRVEDAGSRVLRIALQPIEPFLVPALWMAMFEAQARHRPERALALGRQLLFLRPDETRFWNDLVRWLAFTAPVPALEARPPRFEEALRHVLEAIELAREGLDQRADPERFELLALILTTLQTDDEVFGDLGEAYARVTGMPPLEELIRIGEGLSAPRDPAIEGHLAHAWQVKSRVLATAGRPWRAMWAASRACAHARRWRRERADAFAEECAFRYVLVLHRVAMHTLGILGVSGGRPR